MNSFLWTIKQAPPYPPSYLFGTIHVPYTRVWDYIPDNSKQAFHNSPNVFFELDLTDPLTISKLTSCQLLPHGENLQKLLPRDLYRRLKRHLDYVKHMMPYWMTADQRGRGLYADYLFNAIAGNWERKRPVWVMLMVNSLTEWDVRSRGTPVLDLFLAQEAERMGKTTGAVERVEEQCHPLNGLNFSQVGKLMKLYLKKKNRQLKQKRHEWSSINLFYLFYFEVSEFDLISKKKKRSIPKKGSISVACKVVLQEKQLGLYKNSPECALEHIFRCSHKMWEKSIYKERKSD